MDWYWLFLVLDVQIESLMLLFIDSYDTLRATTSFSVKFPSILEEKTYFFYFTHSLLQNSHISLFILHIYSIK